MNIVKIIAELKSERDRLDRAIAALGGVSNQRKSGNRIMSAEARERIAKAQRERWRKYKAAKKKG